MFGEKSGLYLPCYLSKQTEEIRDKKVGREVVGVCKEILGSCLSASSKYFGEL